MHHELLRPILRLGHLMWTICFWMRRIMINAESPYRKTILHVRRSNWLFRRIITGGNPSWRVWTRPSEAGAESSTSDGTGQHWLLAQISEQRGPVFMHTVVYRKLFRTARV
ncbi:hypothetical protein B0H10DRAFT_1942931 [Mycena sp. CBHHK59/15]|nr:hypothetical protein B0H10DRAFT_1942931 [Mycena sp. CBHHK59/15]